MVSPARTVQVRSTPSPMDPTDQQPRSHGKPDMARPPRKASKKTVRRVIGAGLLSAGIFGGALTHTVEQSIDNAAANSAQPSCDVAPEGTGDGAGVIRDSVTEAGDDVSGEGYDIVRNHGAGKIRDPRDSSSWVRGERLVAVDDVVRIEHVDPNVCLAVGGKVVAASQE